MLPVRYLNELNKLKAETESDYSQKTKVFVGSLPAQTKVEEIRKLFEKYGIVVECDIMNRCAFVHFQTEDMADNAIQALNNVNFKGSNLSVERGRMKDRNAGPKSSSSSNTPGRKFDRQGGGRFNDNSDNNRQGGGSGGPMRRDRANNNRGGPYNRTGGRDGFDNRFDGSSPMNMSSRGGPMDRMGNGMGGGNGMNNYGGFSFSNEDRRGFALPERQIFPNDMGGMYDNRGGMNALPMYDNRGGLGNGPPPMGGGFSGMRGGSSGGERMSPFDRQPPMGPMDSEMYSRRPQMGAAGGGSMGGNRGGPSNSGYQRNMGGGNDYNSSFPPLGGGGGNNDRGNRNNGPPPPRINRRF